jgi:precorrin-6Y C5,15-methyltransferase (decarboxylating)
MLAPHLQPGRKIFALSADAETPLAVATYLVAHGFADSKVHLLEALGGDNHRVRSATASNFAFNDIHPLNLLGIEVVAGADARIIPLANGLPDNLFDHDGQITKREVRAITLSSLAPRAGELLWDVGCGAGSIAIEWLLAYPANRAIGIERDTERAARSVRNAAELGVPHFKICQGNAPGVFSDMEAPDAIYVGGGGHMDGLINEAWKALKPGGRIVINGVTLQTETRLFEAMQSFGGELTRISIERQSSIGTMQAFRPAMTVTQWRATKR